MVFKRLDIALFFLDLGFDLDFEPVGIVSEIFAVRCLLCATCKVTDY